MMIKNIPFIKQSQALDSCLRFLMLCCIFACSLFLFSGCMQEKVPAPPAEPPSPSFPVTLQVAGQSFQIKKKPQKIVSLTPDITEALDDIGASGLIAGVSDYCKEITGLSSGKPCGTAQAIDMEAIKSINPDVILSSSPITENQHHQLALLEITVIEFGSADSVEQISDKYLNLFLLCFGETSGREQGIKFSENFQKKLSSILSPAKEFAELTQKKTAIYLANLDTTMATGDTFEGYLLDEMGLINLAGESSHWILPQETIDEISPDIIFYDGLLIHEEIRSHEIYKDSAAVSKDALYPIDFGAISRRNLSMLDQLDIMAQACYPDAFVGNYGGDSQKTTTNLPENTKDKGYSDTSKDEDYDDVYSEDDEVPVDEDFE